ARRAGGGDRRGPQRHRRGDRPLPLRRRGRGRGRGRERPWRWRWRWRWRCDRARIRARAGAGAGAPTGARPAGGPVTETQIGWTGLAASLVLIAVAIALSGWQHLRLSRSILWATARAAVQLFLVGWALKLVL